MKGGRKVICGTQNGVLNVWSWGTWGDISDRFPGHPQSIDALLKIDEDTLLTGSSDGVVRIVQIHPDRMLGVLGDNDGFPVEKLKFSSGRKLVGSVSHDTLIRLWDASILIEEDVDEDDGKGDSSMEDIDDVSNAEFAGASASAAVTARLKNGSDDEWEDMDDSDDSMDKDSDDSDDSDEEMQDKKPKFKTENEQFFSDL
jgi:WD40 repeat protein